MITNNCSNETEAKLADFFKIIDPATLAKSIRQINHLLALSLMRECETLELEKKNVENGYYWLNELAEILNPYLDAE
ncbi:hypothetical protein [Flavobacterium sp. N1736]|uniref:hypothetical protein n=1 Tax=Flavobacterium sp. N1736 TaxID=2986823 RepID=UPI002225B3CE|nr:hypothetical protein [Flavobacterium sp. N1736]